LACSDLAEHCGGSRNFSSKHYVNTSHQIPEKGFLKNYKNFWRLTDKEGVRFPLWSSGDDNFQASARKQAWQGKLIDRKETDVNYGKGYGDKKGQCKNKYLV